MMEKEDGLLIEVVSRKRMGHIFLTNEGIWVPRRKNPSARDAPNLIQMMLGSSLDAKKLGAEGAASVDMGKIIDGCEEPRDIRRKLESIATEIPYTMILRCYIARPGKFRRAKLAFESFDERSASLISREFHVSPDCIKKLEDMLSSLISDRLEIH